ncbi:MAG TPA: hypothetical protein VK208_10510 [Pyrinomonadaceae bacterium]|nr:hypothetical protein [Pyrinomonadaceae bacterium]
MIDERKRGAISRCGNDNFEDCEEACDGMSEAEIDEMLAESFPASDPRSWTLGGDEHCESSQKRIEARAM